MLKSELILDCKEYMMVDGLVKKYPRDVIIHIVLRFPVKFLLRIKCVSKTFYSLIQSSTFINLHLNHTTPSTYDSILFKRSFKEDIEKYKAIFSILSSDHNDYLKFTYQDLDVPYRTSRYSITNDKLMGPCHGLIALMISRTTLLINPSTRRCRLLPSSPFDVPKGFYKSIESVGFGFDSVVNDFKVFTIYHVYTNDAYGYPEEGTKKIEVYELSIDIWRELDHVDQHLPVLFWSTSSILYNGAYFWITTSEQGEHMSHIETHHQMEISQDYNVYESWNKKYTIRGIPTELPLVVWKDYLLGFQSNSGYLMSYDLNCDEIKELNIYGCLKSMRAIIYEERLTPIPTGSQNSTQVEYFK
ncbi:hypothetical protein H5410_003251 [Solanum commersonii]|uniref:F-box domain-containing protein n=1 Tax=Solanum commersonii TaxID=4109 RepID=A0A9J6B459_SOLCO|nr:hypothetical protein H5410_003251 [Solanum commersonii]